MNLKPVSFFSGALFSRKTCFVYLPPSYDRDSERRYPVIYLLHGMNGTEIHWIVQGRADRTVEAMIGAGQLRECIVVMPNDGGYGQGTFYVDWYDGTGNFEQYILYDLIPFIDAEFRTIPERQCRVVGGYSMGGFGAFSLALRHPSLFGAAASMSGGLATPGTMPYREYSRSQYARMFGPLYGPYAKSYDLHELAAQRAADPEQPALYLDCGTEDELYPLNAEFHRKLRELGYPHKYQEFPGGHNWEYWTEHLTDALRFFEQYFAAWQQAKPPAGE
jgi:S-formylglutathione hydrolase FrmB